MHRNNMLENLLGSTPSSDNPLVTSEILYKKVVVHYWEDYNAGKHHVLEVNAGPDFTVEDLMLSMFAYLDINAEKALINFVIRIANKDGLPKIDMPMFEINQKVQSVEFVRFSLCSKALDEKARLSMKELIFSEDDKIQIEKTNQNKEETSTTSKSIWKKLLCCCR